MTGSILAGSFLFFSFIFNQRFVFAWPDGAPCLSATMKDMRPSAFEHRGGAQPEPAPFRIRLNATCYWPHTPISVQLEALPGSIFKGFAMQSRIKGTQTTFGEILRDDNGSWKYQCFKSLGAITHSHVERKVRVPITWMEKKNLKHDVEFVATVVENVKKYWVQQVKASLPYCRYGDYPEVPKYEQNFAENLPEFENPTNDGYCFSRWDEGTPCEKGWTRVYTFQQGFCTPRFWAGCGGTPNKFRTLRDCEKLCYPRGTIAFGKK